MRVVSLFVTSLLFAAPAAVFGANLRGQENSEQPQQQQQREQGPPASNVTTPEQQQRVPPANATTGAGGATPGNASVAVNATEANSTKHRKF